MEKKKKKIQILEVVYFLGIEQKIGQEVKEGRKEREGKKRSLEMVAHKSLWPRVGLGWV